MFSLRHLKKSFRYAFQGLSYTWHNEQNFRIQIVVGLAVLTVAVWLGLSALRSLVLVLIVTMVLVLELLNTFFEKLVDLLAPRLHLYVEMLKDILAASVFVASLGAAIVGLLIFWPTLINILNNLGLT